MELEVLNRKAAADGEINWVTAGFMAAFHVGAIAAIFFFTWKALLVSMLLWWIAGGMGIGMGYHRLLTHRSFATSKPVEYLFAAMGSMSVQGPVISWVSDHRKHHAHADEEGECGREGEGLYHEAHVLIGEE